MVGEEEKRRGGEEERGREEEDRREGEKRRRIGEGARRVEEGRGGEAPPGGGGLFELEAGDLRGPGPQPLF